MITDFMELSPESYPIINQYVNLREIYIAERQFVNQYIWSLYYDTKYAVTPEFLFYLIKVKGETGAFMPFCQKKDIVHSFYEIKDYFNQELKKPLKMYLVDEEFLQVLTESPQFAEQFDVVEYRDGFDYIYEAEKLKTLSGRKLHKKKNHLNQFLKAYDGRYEYRHLCCENMDEVRDFHDRWLAARDITDKNDRNSSIDKEEAGIYKLMSACGSIQYNCGGIYIDGKLEAYSIGSYDPQIKCAYIHIEKANSNYHGLYNYINQQFLLNEFPEAVLVNREDDLGQEGLRQSKMSYYPFRLEKKYHIFQKTQ